MRSKRCCNNIVLLHRSLRSKPHGGKRHRSPDNIRRPMITAHLVGDDAVLAWLRATPDLAASGLARAITTLGIELQRKIRRRAHWSIPGCPQGPSRSL